MQTHGTHYKSHVFKLWEKSCALNKTLALSKLRYLGLSWSLDLIRQLNLSGGWLGEDLRMTNVKDLRFIRMEWTSKPEDWFTPNYSHKSNGSNRTLGAQTMRSQARSKQRWQT